MALYKIIYFDEIPSTQTTAHELIASRKAGDHSVIVAGSQSDGHGRFRRKWVSEKGNLYASFVYACEERDPRLSYAVAVAVAETLLSFGIEPNIKWPNDILVNNKKISGILIEYYGRFVVVGIGINIAKCPQIAEYPTTKINDYVTASVKDVMAKLMKSLEKWLKSDFAIVRNRWMNLANGLNTLVKYRGATAELIGINENGALVLRYGSRYILAYGDEIMM